MVNCMEQKRKWLWGALAWMAAFCLCAIVAQAEPGVSATLDRTEIELGETVVLTLTFEDCSPASDPALQIPGVQVGNPNVGSRFEFNNGTSSTSKTYSYEILPSKEGPCSIPGFQFSLNNGRSTVTRPLTLTVRKPSADNGEDEAAFVRLQLPRQDIFLGETIPATIECYWQDGGNIQRPQLVASGFSVSGLGDYDRPNRQVRIKGKIYNQLVFHAAVTPAKAGMLELGPATWSLTVLTGPPDIFGRPTRQRQVNAHSQVFNMQAHPLPTNNAPAEFSGAIGQFSLASYEAGPTNLTVGDPITLKIRIAGSGAFDSVTVTHNPSEWQDFKLYPANANFESNDPLRIEGAKFFEQVILPQNATITQIPAFSFVFFDPIQKAYRTLSHPPVPILVRPAVATPQPTVLQTAQAPNNDTPQPARDIVHIQPVLGKPVRMEGPLLTQAKFLASVAVAPLFWIGAVLWRRRKEQLAANPKLLRRRALDRLLRNELRALPGLARDNQKDAFYGSVVRILQEVLGERLDLPASAITEAALDQLPPEERELAVHVRDLFQACNQYRYAPDHGSAGLEALAPQIETVVARLRAAPGAPISKAAAGAVVGVIFAVLACGAASAQTADEPAAFSAANRLYEQGKYAEASAAYDKLIQSGPGYTSLYFNDGNAWFKAGRPGRAILAWRQAERLNPRNPAVRANLRFVRAQIGTANPPSSGGAIARLLEGLTLNEWSIAAGGAVAILFLYLGLQQLLPAQRARPRWITFALGALAVALTAGCALMARVQLGDKIFVVTVPETVARRGPFPESPTVFVARDGLELMALGSVNEWTEVADASGHAGWVPRADITEAK